MYFEKRKRKNGVSWYVHIEYMNIYGQKEKYAKGGFKTKKQAQEHGLEVQNKLNKGVDIKQKRMTINEIFKDYMDVVGKTKLSRNTKQSYCDLFKNHVKHKLGNRLIEEVHYRDLQLFFNEMNLSKNTCSLIKGLLSNVFKYALQNGYIETNPIRDVEIHGKEAIKVESITYKDFELILEYALTSPYKNSELHFTRRSYVVSFYLGYYLGLRISETLALEKSDFDFKNNVVTINKQLVHHGLKKKDYYVTDKMKSRTSKAVLPIPKPLKDVLVEWFEYNPYDLVCCNVQGDYICVNALTIFISDIRKKTGINFHYHCLRHSCASNLVTSGVDVATASKLLRHANVTTTLNVYTDAKQNDMKKAIEATFSDDNYKKPHSILTESSNNALN